MSDSFSYPRVTEVPRGQVPRTTRQTPDVARRRRQRELVRASLLAVPDPAGLAAR
jgi:hypothetical protein